MWHEVRWERETDLIEIYYEPGFFREWSPERVAALLGSETLPEAADDPVVWNFALAICSWCAEQAPSASIITEIGGLMGKRLVSRHGESRARRKGPRLTDDQRRRLDAYIQTNIAKRISVPDLAQAVSMSVSHFVVLCRDTTGRTPTDYLRESRLWKAHAMMRTGSHRRSEIARACGFYDSSHLNREFKRFFKHPPGPLAAENVYPSR
ncbi:MAG TPA: AraC family transcriptional regulator [Opitutaceae bacterium]|nr:AraC family transcriptional regulator [Opitutaceae bacterium]